MSITLKRGIRPEKILPKADAAYLHSYRVYLQVVYCKTFMRADIDAISWGWCVKDGKLEPTMMTNVSQTNIFDILKKCHMSLNLLIHPYFSPFSGNTT